ncbi:LIP-domain-containing protein [Athelia psychrophila]|uniref:triacylglycerol lipase n=1 Tax=Athelia psychrophila TaxID=1759441 RepID=A0A166DTP8_9AGAM|nr:LIP-domain-containing protein [Fibularhizoctonia sp. CBS 109695]
MLRLPLSAVLLLGSTLAAAALIPSSDPFYQPPAHFASTKPGTVFKNRTVPSGYPGITAVQLLYRTTYVNGSAAATVTTILTNSTTKDTEKLVAYSDAEDSANSTCAPSYAFSNSSTSTIGGDMPVGLSYGWTLVVSDYEGINSAFGSGRQEGYAVLDGLRAALNYKPARVQKHAKLAGYGYSGGAIATGWAASLHPTYAPELNIVGWAFGGTPANITSTLQNVDGTLYAYMLPDSQVASVDLYSQVPSSGDTPSPALRGQILTAAGQAAIALVTSQCSDANLEAFYLKDIESTTYQTLGDQLLYDPVIAKAMANGTMGVHRKETPTAPVYMYHGVSDEVIPYAAAAKTARAWCNYGASIEFVSETGGTGHVGTAGVLTYNATSWLDLRLDGRKPARGCHRVADAASGSAQKRSVGAAIERFGVGDGRIVDDMRQRKADGLKVPALWSYLWST